MKYSNIRFSLLIGALLLLFGTGATDATAQNIRRSNSISSTSPNIRPDVRKGGGAVRGGVTMRHDRATTATKNAGRPSAAQRRDARKSTARDTVYAINMGKQHGWFIPNGIITKEQAKHRSKSVMFTGKNARGHWTKIELVDAYGRHVKGAFTPYILNNSQDDDKASKEWKKDLNEGCIILLIADPTGDNVIQERCCDEKGNVIYIFSRTPIGEENGRPVFFGTYRDKNGLPAEMRQAEGYNYGTTVRITEDIWGNDSIIQLQDAKGSPKQNADGAYRSVYTHDKQGNALRNGSQDDSGHYTKDSWGNCGIISTYNDDQTLATATYTNEQWQPMVMPSERAAERQGIVKVAYYYDAYKRDTLEAYFNADDQPMENSMGTHRIRTVYDDKGNVVEHTGYNLQRHPSPLTKEGYARLEYRYDDKGNEVFLGIYDCDLKPFASDGIIAERQTRYNEDGTTAYQRESSVRNGVLTTTFQYSQGQGFERRQYEDAVVRDSLDSKGRNVGRWYLRPDSTLYNCNDGWAYRRTTYTQDGSRQTTTEEYFDNELKPVVSKDGYSRHILIEDTIQHLSWIYRYRFDEIYECYRKMETEEGVLIGQQDVNRFGTICRAGSASSVRHYNAIIQQAPYAQFSTLTAKDEFGEPDFVTCKNGKIYYYEKETKNGTIYYDDENDVISNYGFKAARDRLPKVMTIEVVDSMAYRHGLRDNDIVLLYGNYTAYLDLHFPDKDLQTEWTVRTVLDAQTEKRMVVFRVTDAAKGEYGLVEIPHLKGTSSALGFIPHIRYLTTRQRERILAAIDTNAASETPLVSKNDFTTKKAKTDHPVIVAFPELYRSDRGTAYARQITDPSIILATCIADKWFKWSAVKTDCTQATSNDAADRIQTTTNDDASTGFDQVIMAREDAGRIFPMQDFYLTTDGHTLSHIGTEERDLPLVTYSTAYLTDEEYAGLSALCIEAGQLADKAISKAASTHKEAMTGKWVTEAATDKDDDSNANLAYFDFRPDGTFQMFRQRQGVKAYSDAKVWIRDYAWQEGQWENGGNWLFFTLQEADSLTECYDVTDMPGIEEDGRVRLVKIMNERLATNRDNTLEGTQWQMPDCRGRLIIIDVQKTRATCMTAYGDTIVLVRTDQEPPQFAKIRQDSEAAIKAERERYAEESRQRSAENESHRNRAEGKATTAHASKETTAPRTTARRTAESRQTSDSNEAYRQRTRETIARKKKTVDTSEASETPEETEARKQKAAENEAFRQRAREVEARRKKAEDSR